ncbi:hypothetical protein L9F63_008022 [Diploptera punctata]|uniref:Cytochrome c oxidase assembly protein COX16 homolog, mitochondrial n=1 Tax=Diploptera punctata TaxID=6984 RepID=A0AAD8E340_DIPPU|nr:hypothetical protein L9F63_008022 [Diploptera punctata]
MYVDDVLIYETVDNRNQNNYKDRKINMSNSRSIKYEFSKRCPVTPEMAEKYGVKMRKPGEVTLEGEYEKMKELDIDNWSNIRGPRPWEEDEGDAAKTPT